jgi:tight adherence protein C
MEGSLLAAIETVSAAPLLLPLTASLTALAVGRLVWVVIGMSDHDFPHQADSWEFDAARRIRLRKGSLVYRICEPLVDELAAFSPLLRIVPLQRARRNLATGASDLPWTAEELAATKAIEGLLAAITLAYVFSSFMSTPTCILAAVLIGLGYPQGAFVKLNKQAIARLSAIRRRLPYGVDLMALMMEAGADFRESLATVAAENRDHPLGQELGKIHRAVERGQTLRQAMIEFRDRLQQDDVSEFVFSILKAQELGTPLGKIFLTLADQMRLKRFQWAEKKAAEAETRMEQPVLLLMIGCLIIAVGPFVLRAASGYLP